MKYGIPKGDVWIPVCTVGLVAIGLLANYSTGYSGESSSFTHFHRQLLWAGVGFALMLTMLAVPTKLYQSLAYVLYGIGVLFLIAVLISGKAGSSAARWIAVGPFHFQPSELAKLTTVLGLAKLISDNHREIGRTWLTVLALAMAGFPMLLVLVEPDLGTSLVFPVLLFCLLAWAGMPASHLLILLCPVAAVMTSWSLLLHLIILVVFALSLHLTAHKKLLTGIASAFYLAVGAAAPRLWAHLHPYQQKRILTFLNPEEDPLGSAYQLIQSKIAIGSGALTGTGLLSGSQTQLKFLPEGHTDFIFSAWAEEFGFLGAVVVPILFFVIFYRGIKLASKCHNGFYSLTVIGIVCIICFQALTNLLMTVGYLPVTGLPLPFISYGGSSLLASLASIGLLLGISIRWREY